jgi:hypothetical protein
MPNLRLTDVDEATGLLREEYDSAIERAGKVFNYINRVADSVGVEDEPEWG